MPTDLFYDVLWHTGRQHAGDAGAAHGVAAQTITETGNGTAGLLNWHTHPRSG